MSLGLRVMLIRFALRPTEANMKRFVRWAFLDFDRALDRNGAWLEAFSAYDLSRSTVPHVKRTMRRLAASCTKRVPDSELRRIDVPTALLWGRHDRFVPLSLAEETSARLGWPLEVIDDVGHAPHMERPEAFLEALQALEMAEL
jgi:2-hydroxymuconate-semialdehyde hydrolase